MRRYEHTQIGWVTIIGLAGVLGILAIVADQLGWPWFAWTFIGIFVVMLILFATLTTSVDETHLRWKFGVGLVRGSIHLDRVKDAAAVTNRWWHGWGIHLTPSGWVYNVSGFGAVEVTKSNGSRFRLGTDEPNELCIAILERLQERAGGKPMNEE